MPKLWVAGLLLALLLLPACAPVDESTAQARAAELPLHLVATTGMIADAAKAIAGDRAEVETLMGPGIDPHVYKASEGDVELLVGSDLVLYNGLHLEAKLGDVLERLDERTAAVTNPIPRSRLLAPAAFKGQYDPHVWFDVGLWRGAAEGVRDALIDLDPAGEATYRRNAARYLETLAELDTWVRRRAATVPERQRVLVTAHDAFNYFGRAYGFDVRGLQGISTATEAGAADVQDLARFIAERRIRTIFVESSVSPRAIEAVRAAVRSRGFDVRIGEPLFSDAMGNPGTPEGSYVGMVKHNVDAIVNGLGGER